MFRSQEQIIIDEKTELSGDPLLLTDPFEWERVEEFSSQLLVVYALETATETQRELFLSTESEITEEVSSLSPEVMAWFQVDGAFTHALLEIAPSASESFVSVETQRIARSERQIPPGELHLEIRNTRESYQIRLYNNAGRMRHDALDEVAIALRDSRAGHIRTPTPRLIAMLYRVGQYYDRPLQVISGYRVRGINASSGSRHGSASACDFRVEGVGTRELARYLEENFAQIGVGYYPTSRFVHLDVRSRSFYWIDRSGPGERSRTRRRNVSIRANANEDTTLETIHINESWLYRLPPND